MITLPRSSLPHAERPRPEENPPAQGDFESDSSRRVVLFVQTGSQRVRLEGWCRVGVWTTLLRVGAARFVTRESWGRLGDRAPRRLAQIHDQVLGGVTARLRPEADGSLRFRVETAEARRGRSRPVGIYHGERITLGDPRRHGYRFAGRAPAGWRGAIAVWEGTVAIYLDEERADARPRPAVHFRAGDVAGFVAGESAEAEAFEERWEPAEPILVDADGVERIDYRLDRHRRASGFFTDQRGRLVTHGARFSLSRDG